MASEPHPNRTPVALASPMHHSRIPLSAYARASIARQQHHCKSVDCKAAAPMQEHSLPREADSKNHEVCGAIVISRLHFVTWRPSPASPPRGLLLLRAYSLCHEPVMVS